MKAKEDQFRESVRITLELFDGTEQEYEIVGIFAVDNHSQYMALHPWDHEDEAYVQLVPFEEGQDGEVAFRDFRDEKEYQQAEAVFQEMFTQDEEEMFREELAGIRLSEEEVEEILMGEKAFEEIVMNKNVEEMEGE
ncbi:MAG: DUF1292 domain-containing protein [Eubacteriales bacterium]|nr:DUF1292 domain-containing protein [Eubacteriales bacterium]